MENIKTTSDIINDVGAGTLITIDDAYNLTLYNMTILDIISDTTTYTTFLYVTSLTDFILTMT
jgi:hypothetical protein